MKIEEQLRVRSEEVRKCLNNEPDLVVLHDRLEQLRMTLEIFEGNTEPRPARVPGSTQDLFGRRFLPEASEKVFEQIATETRGLTTLRLLPHLDGDRQVCTDQFKTAVELVRLQVERLVVLGFRLEPSQLKGRHADCGLLKASTSARALASKTR